MFNHPRWIVCWILTAMGSSLIISDALRRCTQLNYLVSQHINLNIWCFSVVIYMHVQVSDKDEKICFPFSLLSEHIAWPWCLVWALVWVGNRHKFLLLFFSFGFYVGISFCVSIFCVCSHFLTQVNWDGSHFVSSFNIFFVLPRFSLSMWNLECFLEVECYGC